ncbi:putative receptor-like protein kinase At5g24010 [Bidens hawaiensis]|uniref:putative receptor-like protein kinase At5g24010 n=1 Tax=Bidens hawaiensis TaxID=980011 RepID=UPI00404A6287
MRGYFTIGNVLNEEVIIKRCIVSHEKLLKDFYIEIKRLTNCSHRNLPSFLGFSDEDSEMILVFECGFKETLNNYLRSTSKRANLTWERRLLISLDIALGFNYLRVVKAKPSMILSANVYLDEEWTAIIADLRLSESNSCSGERLVTDDIYFLGVILFEILTGKLAYDPLYFTENVNGFASKCLVETPSERPTLEGVIDSLREALRYQKQI